MRTWARLALVALSGCSGADATLVVQVRTDLTPVIELAQITTSFESPGEPFDVSVAASDERAWGAGVRVAERSGLTPGTVLLSVSALDDSGAVIVSRPVRVELEAGAVQVVTVLLTRNCEGVVCPGDGDDPSAQACLAGRCVPETCVEESAPDCAPRECMSPMECPLPPDPCISSECTLSGTCFLSPDHMRCADDEVCSDSGCVPGMDVDPGPFGGSRSLDEINGSDIDYEPSISSDGRVLYWSRTGASPSIWRASRATLGDLFAGPTMVMELNGSFTLVAAPTVREDELEVIFTARLPTEGDDLYRATRAVRTDPFSSVELVASLSDPSEPEVSPELSFDGLELIYTRDPGTGNELWSARRPDLSSPFEAATAIDELNTGAMECCASLAEDGLTIVFQRIASGAATDLFVAHRPTRTEPFGEATPVEELNTDGTEAGPELFLDGAGIVWSSNPGDNHDLHEARRAPP